MVEPVGDGYDREGYIAGSVPDLSGRRLWEPLEFVYRQATRPEWVRLDAKVAIIDRGRLSDPECAVKAEQEACDFVAKHLVSWDYKDRVDQALPFSGSNVMSLNAELFYKLYRIIRGEILPDVKPGGEPAKASEELEKN